MKKLYMGQKMIVSALAGMILIPGSVVRIQAAENEEQQSWDSCYKAVSTRSSIILYTSRTTASIFPRKDLGEKEETLIRMISTHMPPKKVKIRF